MGTGPAAAGRWAARLVRASNAAFALIPASAVLLLARLSIASIFWSSGRTKVEPGSYLSLSDGTVQLFQDEYRIAIVTPEIAAYVAMVGEHLLPILLLLGLASRLAALALLCMTLVIEIFVYPEAYNVHGPWAVCLLLIMMLGAGAVSLDHVIARAAATRALP